jgi:HlyD family secretion protein
MIMKRSGYVKNATWGGALLATATAVAWTLRPQPIHVTTATVTRGSLSATVRGEGRTHVRDLFVVAAHVDGELERVVVRPGDAIAAGDILAAIRPAASRPLDARTRAEAKAAVASAKAAVARSDATEAEARVALDHAESQLHTTRRLAQSGSAPAEDLTHRGHEAELRRRAVDAATAAAAQARAELARAQAVISTAGDAGQPTPVPAPTAGRILRVLRDSAGPVAAGTPLFEVGDVHRLELRAELLSSDAAEVRPGAAAAATGWGGPQSLEARVSRIDPAAFTKVSALGLEEQRVRVVLNLAGPPPPGLGHDYHVDVSIVVWTGKDVLRVPSTALFRAGERWAVFRVVDLRARKALVDIGQTDGTSTVVANGLQVADEVIAQPSDAIDDGTAVRRH